MKLDPRNLRVADALRLLNSTPLGEVVQPHLIYRHVQRAGFRIGDGKKIDLAKYTAWLFQEREAMVSAAQSASVGTSGGGGYAAHKEAVNVRGRIDSESARDISGTGRVHQPRDASRRESCRLNFRGFCEQYFQPVFSLAWSDDHLKVIARIENAVLEGGLFAMAMPRSSGKTSLCETACLWALLYGHGRFVVLIAADARLAQQSLESIKDDLVKNDLLEEDFSEVVGPIRALEGIHQRAAGQLYQGRPTYIAWTANEVVLPSIPGSEASGGVIRVTGVTGSIRGMKCRRPDGTSARPDLVLIDDPQTDESARSPEQCADREQVISGAILGLAGPEKSIAALMTLTVVRPGDLADRILDPAIHPSWQGQRTKMVYAFPTNTKLWDEYFRLRAESLRNGTRLDACNRFYADHQVLMDEGAVVAWPARYGRDELSAIQNAMNLRFRVKEAAFAAEYQNDPLPPEVRDKDVMTAQQIAAKVNGLPRKEIPVGAQFVTGFVDVQQEVLYYLVAAWEPNFTGYVVDYGTWPDQGLHYFTSRELTARLGDHIPGAGAGAGVEACIFGGLNALLANLMSEGWRRQDGTEMHLNRCLVDAGFKSDVVYEVCRQHPSKARLLPYWQQITAKYPKSPRAEFAAYDAAVLIYDLANATPTANTKSTDVEKMWKDVAGAMAKFCDAYPQGIYTGDAHLRRMDLALEQQFDLAQAASCAAAGDAWAAQVAAKVSYPKASSLVALWMEPAPPFNSLAQTSYSIYMRAGLIAYLGENKSQATAFFRKGDAFDASLQKTVGSETALQRMVKIAQGDTKSLTPDGLLALVKNDSQKTGIVLADLYLLGFDPVKAGQIYKRLLEGQTPFPKPQPGIEAYLLLRMGQSMEFQKRHDEAMAYLKQLYGPKYAKFPWTADGIFRIGTWTYNSTQDPKDAMQHWKYVFTQAPDSPAAEPALFYYALSATRMKDYKTATQVYNDYLKHYPQGRWASRIVKELLPDAQQKLGTTQ